MPPDVSARHRHSIPLTNDFELDGSGAATAWLAIPFTDLTQVGGASPHRTRCKQLRSATGLYLLVDAEDDRIDCTKTSDGEDLFTEDVVEWFLQPDPAVPVYIEYEISPLGHELPILIPNVDGKFLGWRPWHYEGERKIQKATSMRGGAKKSGASVEGWTAEIFVPYPLLTPLGNVPPKPGTRWRANFYRVDYDDGQNTAWDWARVGPSFHEYEKFGTLVFE